MVAPYFGVLPSAVASYRNVVHAALTVHTRAGLLVSLGHHCLDDNDRDPLCPMFVVHVTLLANVHALVLPLIVCPVVDGRLGLPLYQCHNDLWVAASTVPYE